MNLDIFGYGMLILFGILAALLFYMLVDAYDRRTRVLMDNVKANWQKVNMMKEKYAPEAPTAYAPFCTPTDSQDLGSTYTIRFPKTTDLKIQKSDKAPR